MNENQKWVPQRSMMFPMAQKQSTQNESRAGACSLLIVKLERVRMDAKGLCVCVYSVHVYGVKVPATLELFALLDCFTVLRPSAALACTPLNC